MIRKDVLSAVVMSVYLLVYAILLQFKSTFDLALLMLLASPLVLLWMIYTILKFGKYKGRQLDKDEFGYGDRENEKLGTF